MARIYLLYLLCTGKKFICSAYAAEYLTKETVKDNVDERIERKKKDRRRRKTY